MICLKQYQGQLKFGCFWQVLGFLVLLSGTSLYNELLRGCMPANWSDGPPDGAHQASQPNRDAFTTNLLCVPHIA